MRRRFKKKYILIRISLIIILAICLVGVGYSYLSTTLNIRGIVSGDEQKNDYVITPDSNKNLNISKFSANKWQESGLEKCHYVFDLVNKSNKTYDNFKITIVFNHPIINSSIWNYQYTLSGNTLIITNNKYNLNAYGSLEVGFIISSNFSNTKINTIKIEVDEETNEIDPNKFEVVFKRAGGWGNYIYQYDVKLTNKTGQKIIYWQIDIILPEGTTYESGWNGIFEVNNNVLTIKNTEYNGQINNNASAVFGLQLSTNIINYIPSNIKVTIR